MFALNLKRTDCLIFWISTKFRSISRECLMKFGDKLGQEVWEVINTVFDALPLAAVIDEQVKLGICFSKIFEGNFFKDSLFTRWNSESERLSRRFHTVGQSSQCSNGRSWKRVVFSLGDHVERSVFFRKQHVELSFTQHEQRIFQQHETKHRKVFHKRSSRSISRTKSIYSRHSSSRSSTSWL